MTTSDPTCIAKRLLILFAYVTKSNDNLLLEIWLWDLSSNCLFDLTMEDRYDLNRTDWQHLSVRCELQSRMQPSFSQMFYHINRLALRTNSTANNIMAKLTNDSNNQTYIYHQLTIHNSHDSEDDFRSGCRNVSHCQQQQFFSGLY